MKISQDQTLAKVSMAYFVREAGHFGFSIGIYTQKLTSIDIDIRITMDYLFFKSLGIFGLPSDLKGLYSTYVHIRLQNMPPYKFLLLTKRGSHGIGSFPFQKGHKMPGEDILKRCGIDVDHGEEMIESKPSYQVGDLQHVEICELRIDGYTYKEIAAHQGTSQSTPYSHIVKHNDEVERLGECQKCKRAKSSLSTTKITGEKPDHNSGN